MKLLTNILDFFLAIILVLTAWLVGATLIVISAVAFMLWWMQASVVSVTKAFTNQ